MANSRQMRLTRRHVDLVHREIEDPGPKLLPGFRAATDADFSEAVEAMLASCPTEDFWLFGYGSLIWNPETGFEEKRLGRAIGWHWLIRRELSQLPSAFPWRWISVKTDQGPLKALTFAMDRNNPRYVAGLPDEEIAAVLANACGYRGSMAEYLFSTVAMLESLGIHDRNLWRLQSLVAAHIEASHGGSF